MEMTENRTDPFIFSILIAFLCSAAFAGLIPCPDCGAPVSDRAVMCPGCGCPGDAILAAAHSNKMANVELPAFFHSLIRVTSDQGDGVGVCVQSSGRLYVLTSQELLAGAQTLTLAKMLDGQSIPYTSIELANDRNLARLAVNATNLSPLAIAAASNADLALVHVATNNTVGLIQTGAVNGRLPAGTPLLDAATNVVMLIADDSKHAENVASVPEWVPVQPLAYRTQTILLQQAGKRTGDRAAVLKKLHDTKWLTPYLAKKAETLIMDLQQ